MNKLMMVFRTDEISIEKIKQIVILQQDILSIIDMAEVFMFYQMFSG